MIATGLGDAAVKLPLPHSAFRNGTIPTLFSTRKPDDQARRRRMEQVFRSRPDGGYSAGPRGSEKDWAPDDWGGLDVDQYRTT